MNLNIASYVKTAKSVITANSPVLLLGTTIAGVVTTGVLAAKAGYRARGIVDETQARMNEEEASHDLTNQEIIQLTWMCYTLPAISAAGTIASAVGTHTIHTKRANAMAALYAVTSNKLDDMTERAEELLGPKKTQQLQNDVAQRAVDREEFEDSEILMTDDATTLCYDEMSGRFFMSSMQRLEGAINDINRQLIAEGDASLNDYYDHVGLPPIQMGNSMGWSGGKIDGKFGSTVAKDGRPAISVWFHEAPKENMGCP